MTLFYENLWRLSNTFIEIPTLMSLLSQVVGRASEQSPLICLLASMILKSRHNHLFREQCLSHCMGMELQNR